MLKQQRFLFSSSLLPKCGVILWRAELKKLGKQLEIQALIPSLSIPHTLVCNYFLPNPSSNGFQGKMDPEKEAEIIRSPFYP